MIVTAIYDSVAGTYTPFATTQNVELACRQFKASVLSNKMMLLSPNDFHLYKVAEFDEHEGVYTAFPLQKLNSASDFKEVFVNGEN